MAQLNPNELRQKISQEVLPDLHKFKRSLAPLLRECCICGQLKACPNNAGGVRYICYSCSLLAAELDAYQQAEAFAVEQEGVCRLCGARVSRLYRIDGMLVCRSCAYGQVEKRLTIKF